MLVFDNVYDWETLSTYLPLSCQATSSILITSQNSGEWCNHVLYLPGLDPEAGSALLLNQLSEIIVTEREADRESAEKLSEMLGGSPLLINQAASLIKDCKYSLGEFIIHPLLVGHRMGANKSRYQRPLQQTVDRTLEKLSENAIQFLFTLAFLNPSKIGEDILLGNHNRDYLKFLERGDNG